MAFDTLVKEAFELLPYEKQLEVVDFIMFLSAGVSAGKTKKGSKPFPFDVFAGGLTYISEDFDETPEGFEDYI